MEKLEFLSDLVDRKGNVTNIVANLEEKKQEIEKQIHIARVVAFAYKIEDLISDKIFELNQMDSMEIFYEWDYDCGNVFKCVFNYKDDCDYQIIKSNRYDDESIDPYKIINDYVEDLLGFDHSMIDESFVQNKGFELKLDNDISANIFKLMLSKELSTLLEYNLLGDSLTHNNTSKIKKNKL